MELIIILLPFFGLSLRSPAHCYGDIDYKEETKHVFTTAFHKYNERVRPYNKGLHPVEIKANLEFIDIVSIDTKHGQLESIVDLRVTWHDRRLQWSTDKIPYITVNDSSIWTPDIAFLNALDSPKVIIRPRFVVIERTGNVFQYHRLRITTACKNKNNTCAVQMGSNFFTDSELLITDSQCSIHEELLSSVINIELKNMTANMSIIEHADNLFNVDQMYYPRFSKSTFSIVTCEITLDKDDMFQMEHSQQKQEKQEADDDKTNSAEQTIQRLGFLIIGTCLFFVS